MDDGASRVAAALVRRAVASVYPSHATPSMPVGRIEPILVKLAQPRSIPGQSGPTLGQSRLK